MAQASRNLPDPALLLVTVGEEDFHPVLADLPQPWRGKL